MADLFYQSTEASSEIKVFSQNIVDLRINFENKLLEFLTDEVVNIHNVPNFSVNGSLSVDTNFMKSFANTPLGTNIDQFNLKAENGKISGNSNIPYISTNSVLAEGINLSITKPNDFNQMDLSLLKLHTQIDDLSDVQLSVEINDSINDAFVHLECISKILEGKVSIPTELRRSNLGLRVKFSDEEPIIIGSSPWIASPNSSMLISPSHYPSGYVSVSNEMQNISVFASDDAVSLNVKDLLFDALISELTNLPNTSAKLNTSIQYSYSQKEIEGRIDVTDIVSDSTVLGNIAINIDADDSKQFADLLYQEKYGRLSGSVREFYSSPEFELNLSNLNLESLQTLLNVDSNQIIMDGNVNGNFTGIYDGKLKANGHLEFAQSNFRSNNFGVEGIIDQQVISLTEDKISLTDFTIRNNLNQEILMNGDFALNNSMPLNFQLITDEFKLLNNLKNKSSKSDIKGDFSISSNITAKGNSKGIKITGAIKGLDGNKLDYTLESNVVMEEESNIVEFKSFSNQSLNLKKEHKQETAIPINYDLGVSLGQTDLYILLSKTTNDYLKMKGTGDLKIYGKDRFTPEVFGQIVSEQGNVYYELPVVSTVELDIHKTALKWNGPLDNPVISFDASEQFQITPNEASVLLSETRGTVPVVVEVQVLDKSLKEFELNFNIASPNASLQEIFTALPQETKETYALNMLTFGKINGDADSKHKNRNSAVDKLNEISRRNIKNANLNFSYNSYASDDLNSHNNVKVYGYNYSKSLLEDRLQVSIGGALNFGASPDHKEKLFGEIHIDYYIKKEPNITINAARTNVYHGPIDGQVEQSSLGFGYSANFNNLFKNRKGKKKRKN